MMLSCSGSGPALCHKLNPTYILQQLFFLILQILGIHIFTVPSVSAKFAEQLEQRFNIFREYYIVRNCPECQFIFGAVKDNKIDDHQGYYKKSLGKLEDFCCDFVDSMIDLVKQYNPTYNLSLILNDKQYRKSIIKSVDVTKEKLTGREVECLH